MNKKAVLMVSFGTSYNESGKRTIGAIETAVAGVFKEFTVRRAFTSKVILEILRRRDGILIDNVSQALDQLALDGYETVIIQPTHVMNGIEYEEMLCAAAPFKNRFDSMACGRPLLALKEDYDRVVEIMAEETAKYNREGTAIVCMGHGTDHEANSVYAKLDRCFKKKGYKNYFIGTVEAVPSLNDMIAAVSSYGAKRVILLPLMIVAGDHAVNDMAGEIPGSWKTQFESIGCEVECVMRGLGEYKGIQEMFVKHTEDTIRSLNAGSL